MRVNPVQPVANLKSRLADYKRRRIEWLWCCVGIVIIGICIATMMIYLLARVSGDENLDANWPLIGLVMGILFSYWPALMIKPERPGQSDVERDRALRRHHGMDDTVESD